MATLEFPETGRDADTFRVVIAPPREEELEHDDAPSKWPFAVSIVLGALMGLLVVAKTYVEDHPSVPVGARQTAAAIARPKTGAPARVAPAPAVEAKGFVAVAGPAGANVYDGDVLVGTAPILHGTSAGLHTIRVQHVPSDNSQTFEIQVRTSETTPIVVTFDPHKRAKKNRRK